MRHPPTYRDLGYFRVADNAGAAPLMDTSAFHRTNVEFGEHWPLSALA